jgi:branched-chain amino acid transport system ATP-binding protein
MSLLSIDDLAKAFGGVRAVDGVSFKLAAGEIVALIGPNGAGKSTCFNLLSGQLRPDRGAVTLEGRDITRRAARQIWRLGVARTFQIPAHFASLSVRQNVQLVLISRARQLFGFWKPAADYHRDAALALLARVGMADQAERPCKVLAYGDVKRLELAMALAGAPRLLLLDEPTAGMPPRERASLMDLVLQLANEHQLGVLFTEHDMPVVFEYAHRIVVMARGRIIAQGDPEAVRSDRNVQAAYLGTGSGRRPQRTRPS